MVGFRKFAGKSRSQQINRWLKRNLCFFSREIGWAFRTHVTYIAHQTRISAKAFQFPIEFLHCNVKIKRFSRLPALRFVAPGSVRAEEDQDQARGQGSLQCWRGKWRGWTARTRSCSPPCSHGNQPGKQIWNILRPTWIVGRRPANSNTLMVVVLKVTRSSCKDFTSIISNRQTWLLCKAADTRKDHILDQVDTLLRTSSASQLREQLCQWHFFHL